MLTAEATAPDLRAMSLDALADVYGTGDDDTRAAILAECARRDRADRARQARQAVEATWIDAAFAEYLAAETDCRGHLFSRKGEAEGIADALSLWRGSEAWARARASEELCEWWDAHGGRLSLARYRRELATAKRLAREEYEFADGARPRRPRPEPECPSQRVPGGAVRPATVPIGSLTVTAWAAMDATGAITLHPSRARAEQWLAPAPGPAPAPSAALAVEPGAIARYATALDILTARVLAARARLTNGMEITR
jgi:hypothetical protein